MAEFTDTASDIAEIIRLLLARPPSNEPAWSAILTVAGVKAADAWTLFGVIGSRLDGLQRLIERVDDPDFKESQKKITLQAIHRFSAAFLPQNLTSNWQNHLSSFVREEDATAFDWFSIVARRHQPLKKLTDDERSTLIEKIGEVLSNLEQDDELPRWARAPLADGLLRLRFMLQHLIFFGCDTAIDALSSLHESAQAIEASMVRDQAVSGHEHTRRPPGLVAVVNIVALAVTLFNAPDQMVTAFERYKGWTLRFIARDQPSLQKPVPLLYLTAPAPTAPANNTADAPDGFALKPEELGQIGARQSPNERP